MLWVFIIYPLKLSSHKQGEGQSQIGHHHFDLVGKWEGTISVNIAYPSGRIISCLDVGPAGDL